MSLVPGSGADLDELDCLSQDSIQSELAHWERIVFYGDMEGSSNSRDNGKGKGTLPSTSQSSAPQEEPNLRTFSTVPQPLHNNPLLNVPPHVAPEAYNYLIQALLALQHSAIQQHPQNTASYPHAIPPSQYAQPGPSTYGWPLPPGGVVPNIDPTYVGLPPMYPYDTTPSFQNTAPQMMTPASQSTTQHAVSPTSTGENPDQVDEAIVAEDKRRRNTAASARFRVKRKLKTLNLERTVGDLTGRTEELEREAADLRRENGWLKEIILLKSRGVGEFGAAAAQPVESTSLGARESQESHGGSNSSGKSKGGEKNKGKETSR